MKAKLDTSSSNTNRISLSDRFKMLKFINIRPKKKSHESKTATTKNDKNFSLNTESEKFLDSPVDIQSETVNNEKAKSAKLHGQAGIVKTKEKNNSKCADLRRCYHLFCTNNNSGNSIDEFDYRPPSPVLPMVKFDSTDDFMKEPFKPVVIGVKNENDHIIHLSKHIEIDTKKVKSYCKDSIKFAFSQIGLMGLVVGYVILGAIIIMKIESSYEKENQQRIERNRDDFFANVKVTAENLFNEYLKENFHTKYNQYRNEEMQIKENLFFRTSSRVKLKAASTTARNRRIYEQLGVQNLTQQFKETNDERITDTSFEDYTEQLDETTTKAFTKISRSKIPKYDRRSFKELEKPAWYIELDKEQFTRQIKNHLGILFVENEQMEDKDQQTIMVREEVWNYPNSLLFSATVITTIGYGNITPKSNIGKIFTICYAIIGIPLMLMCLTNTGDLLAEVFISSYTKCIRFFSRRLCKNKLKMPYSASRFHENKEEMMNEFEVEYDNPNDRHVPIVATIGVLTAYILAGAVIFSITEGWNILDGAYFCFITFTTIGFGDFVPGKNTLETEKKGVAALCAIYLLVGMVIMSMCVKLMQDEVIAKVKWFGQRLGIIE